MIGPSKNLIALEWPPIQKSQVWVQVWVQLKKEKWLPISRKRHQIGHSDFHLFRLLTEWLQSSPRPRALPATVLGRKLWSLIEFMLQLPL